MINNKYFKIYKLWWIYGQNLWIKKKVFHRTKNSWIKERRNNDYKSDRLEIRKYIQRFKSLVETKEDVQINECV